MASIKRLVVALREELDPDTYLRELEGLYGLLSTVGDLYREPDAQTCLQQIVKAVSGESTPKDSKNLVKSLEALAVEYEKVGLDDVASSVKDVAAALEQAFDLDSITMDGKP